MLGNNALHSNTKSSKRPKESDSGSESSCRPRKQERRDGHNPNEENSSTSVYPESMETSYPANSDDIPPQSSSHHQESMEVLSSGDSTAATSRQLLSSQLAENIIEVEVDFNEKKGKNDRNKWLLKTGIPDVLDAEIALRNTNGGVIKLKMKTSVSPEERIKKIDNWQLNLNRERHNRFSTLGEKETLDQIIDYRLEDLMIYVKKSSIILTEQSNLYVRRGTEKYTAQTYFQIRNVFQKNDKPNCCCNNGPPINSFIQDKKLPFGESTTVEYKNLSSKKLPDKLRQKLKEYVVQFANTSGGYVYFGISDDAIIKGQQVNDKEAILCKVKLCMESKIWINKFGEKDTPVYDTHYKVAFFQVIGADEHTFVIQVHICQYAGAVFHKEPECRVTEDNNQFGKMSFEKWLLPFLKSVRTIKDNSNYRDRFEKRERGSSMYFSVKTTVDKLVARLKSCCVGELKLHPSHATEWIKHPALDILIEKTKMIFKQNKHSGIAYIDRSWEVNLGLPSTKPDDVICDILLCCPTMPFILVSLTRSAIPSMASHSYNRKVAMRLKTALVQEADCLEKFYVKPVVIAAQQLDVKNLSLNYSESPLYPETYRMNHNKYSNILEALVLILARANVMASHNLGQDFFDLLTAKQYDILHDFYGDSPKMKITGPPGSGKTVLALERIHRLRNLGCSSDEVLFLCSNKPLKARVENMKACDGQSLCIVKMYHEVESLAQSDVGFKIELGNIKHILADEAQNFQMDDTVSRGPFFSDWWSKLNDLCDDREDSSFWVFFDVAQKINNKRSVSLRKFLKKELETVIRQTGNVHRFINSKYMRVNPKVELGHDFDGPKVDILVPSRSNAVSHPMHLIYILILQLHKLIVRDGHHVNDITVLFNDAKQKESYESLFVQQTNNSCPIRNGEEVFEHGVVFDTIRRYCGVDDNIIIGFCPKFYASGFQDNHALMTALCSRTKVKLILIMESEQEAKRFDLAPAELQEVKFGNINKIAFFPGSE